MGIPDRLELERQARAWRSAQMAWLAARAWAAWCALVRRLNDRRPGVRSADARPRDRGGAARCASRGGRGVGRGPGVA